MISPKKYSMLLDIVDKTVAEMKSLCDEDSKDDMQVISDILSNASNDLGYKFDEKGWIY